MNQGQSGDRIKIRKKPQQDRSVQRVQNILAVASRLLCEFGSSGLKMTDIAREAGIPIGSVYQYFPEKAAIIKSLYDANSRSVQSRIAEAFAHVQSQDDAFRVIETMIDWYYEQFSINPLHIQIWLGVETDRELLHLNNEESRAISQMFCDVFRPFMPADTPIDMEARALLFSHLIGSAVRLAVFQKDTDLARRIIVEIKSAIHRAFFE